MKNITFYIISLFLMISSCDAPQKQPEDSKNASYQPEYAKFFRIDYYQSYKRIQIIHPWGNESLNMDYYFPINDQIEISNQSENSFIIDHSPETIIALSSPMVGLMNLLELEDHIKGVTDPYLIYNKDIRDRIDKGQIQDVGKSIQINMEKMMVLQPDLVVGSGWDQLSEDYIKMIQLNMTPVLMYDWQELHPLGKAEWMIALAAFFNEEEKAIELFKEIQERYTAQKESLQFEKQPVVFNGSEYQGIWYSAGGQSYMSKLYADAQADYLMKEDSSTGSVMLDFEVVMLQAAKADIWMYTGSMAENRLELMRTPKYQSLDAIRNGRIFSYHKRMDETGANDYWETASFRPDIVLGDLIKIFHEDAPEEMYYFKKVAF